jgi:hypothetical protein
MCRIARKDLYSPASGQRWVLYNPKPSGWGRRRYKTKKPPGGGFPIRGVTNVFSFRDGLSQRYALARSGWFSTGNSEIKNGKVTDSKEV